MMYKARSSLFVLAVVAGAASAQATQQPVVTTTTVSVAPTTQAAMQRLSDASQGLSDAVRVLANKPAGPDRDAAIHEAQKALARTQQAMRDMPREYRVATTRSTPAYDASVQALMKTADQLRGSIHAMAREPAGPRRNQAIREANQALLDTQAAMAQAFDATYAANAPASTTTVTLGAGPAERTIVVGPGSTANCLKLGAMLGCK
jgi:hypothetical protein